MELLVIVFTLLFVYTVQGHGNFTSSTSSTQLSSSSYHQFSPTFTVSKCTEYTSESNAVQFGTGNGYATWQIGCNSGKPTSGGCIVNAVGAPVANNIFMYKSYTDPGANLHVCVWSKTGSAVSASFKTVVLCCQ